MEEIFTCRSCIKKLPTVRKNEYNYYVCYDCKNMICKNKECGYESADFFGTVYKCRTCYAMENEIRLRRICRCDL